MDHENLSDIQFALFHENFKHKVWPKLWKHQKEAIKEISEYLENVNDVVQWKSKLIALPTGSGKSGIISSIARFSNIDGVILVLVPRCELRTQLAKDMCGTYRGNNIERGRFFEKAEVELYEIPQNGYPKEVTVIEEIDEFKDSFGTENDWRVGFNNGNQHILITTIQLLTYMWTNSGKLASHEPYSGVKNDRTNNYKGIVIELLKAVNMVIFDEGHYEPAPTWSEVVRSFNVPKLIFTATPFRNDLRSFDWDTDNVFHRTFSDMVTKYKKIRGIKIREFPIKNLSIKQQIEIIEQQRLLLEEEFGESVEVIIRVGSRARIIEVSEAILDLNVSYKAIHSRPLNKNESETLRVEINETYPIDYPRLNKYWIHQNKLLEGIDRSQISMLVILDRLKNMRALVQQIGRLTRKDYDKNPRPFALVLDPHGEVSKQWQQFMDFEESLKKDGFNNRTAEEFLQKVFKGISIENIVTPIYADGWPKYILTPQKREWNNSNNANLEADGPWDNIYKLDYKKDLIVSTNAQVLEIIGNKDENWPKIVSHALSESNKRFDRLWRILPINHDKTIEDIDTRTLVIMGISANASPHLQTHAFYDIKLEVMLLYRTDPYVFIFDSTGTNNRNLSRHLDYGKPKTLLYQLKQFDRQAIKSVSLLSSRQGRGIVLSQTLNSIDMTSIPTSLSDPTQIVSAAKGYAVYEINDVRLELRESMTEKELAKPPDPFGRRIGVSRRKISDYGEMLSINDFCEWAESLANNMRFIEKDPEAFTNLNDSNIVISNYFNRFAPEAQEPPEKWKPRWMYLDLARFENEHVKVGTGKREIAFPILIDSLIEIDESNERFFGVIKVEDSGTPDIKVQVKYNQRTGRYSLESEELDTYRPVHNKTGQTILQILNNENSFTILPEDKDYFYAMGSFYLPGIKFGAGYNESKTGLLSTIIDIQGLRHIRKEKGKFEEFSVGISEWPNDSLFGIVDAAAKGKESINRLNNSHSRSVAKNLRKYLGEVEWLVCDDMGPERADFLAITRNENNEKHVIMIHAKAKPITKDSKSPSSLSATALSDVCMQAIKNLDFLGPRIADHTRDWQSQWTLKKEKDPKDRWGLDRIRVYPSYIDDATRKDPLKIKEIAEREFEYAINNPSVLREVWILTGGILQKEKLEELLKNDDPPFGEVPIVYTLYGTMSIVASSPALFRVFSY